MKKFTKAILFIFLIFSIENTYASNDWILEELLNINYWPVSYDLSLEKLDNYNFKNKTLAKKYSDLVKIDDIIRQQVINKFQNDDYSYTTTNAIVRNYKDFIYYTNNFFYFLSVMDKNPSLKSDVEIQAWLLESYKESVNSYKKVKRLISEQ